MNVLPRDEDGIVIEPCIDCVYHYVEDIWLDDMCDKPKIQNDDYENCPYYRSEE